MLGRVAWRVWQLDIVAAGAFQVRFQRLHPVPVRSQTVFTNQNTSRGFFVLEPTRASLLSGSDVLQARLAAR